MKANPNTLKYNIDTSILQHNLLNNARCQHF
jgi:hypothetical protein